MKISPFFNILLRNQITASLDTQTPIQIAFKLTFNILPLWESMTFFQGIAALHCCVSLYCPVKWISHTYTYISPLFWISFPFRSPQSTEKSSLYNKFLLVIYFLYTVVVASQVTQTVKNPSACNTGDPGLIPGTGRSPLDENNYLLQYSCLENSRDRGAWLQSMGLPSRIWLSD